MFLKYKISLGTCLTSVFLILFVLQNASGRFTIPGGPGLLYATHNDVRFFNTSRGSGSRTGSILVRDLQEATAMDYHYAGQQICWTDHNLEMIICMHYNGTHSGPKTNVITNGLISPDGLAIDWWTDKLYWTDGETNKIEVATIDGKLRKVLFWSDIDQPRAIAVVPMRGYMFWTDWGEVPKIERAGMDGDPDSRIVIVSENIFWPNGLTIDHGNEKIYWLDGKLLFIESMDYNGKNRETILKGSLTYPFALTYFENKIYWTDWELWTINVFDKSANTSPAVLVNSDIVPMDIHVWNKQRQPYGVNPCLVNNGNCSHLCLLSPNPPGYKCSCPTGVKLLTPNKCAEGPQELLLLVQRTDLGKISLDLPDYTNFILPLSGIKHAIAIDFDPVDNYIYWTDDEVHAIRRAHLDGTGQEDIITNEVKHPDGVAVDWLARNLYWTDTGTDRIEVSKLNGMSRRVLINEGLIEPRAIALAPQLGWMFWSDWNDDKPKIERAALDGTERLVLVGVDLGWPNGIALDVDNKMIYWCDAKKDRIEMARMDGTERRALLSDSLPHGFGLTLLGNYLYWTDWQRRSIDRVHKITGSERQVIIDQVPNLMGLKAVKINEVKGNNPCTKNNGGCSHLCLNRPKNYICACQIGYELSKDKKTCVIPSAFLLVSRKESIERLSIENSNVEVIVTKKDIKEAMSLDYNIADSRIYWTDIKFRSISSAYLNGSDVQRIVELGLIVPESVAVDWIALNLYWSDTGSHRIEVARLDGSNRRVLIWKNVKEPRNIVLEPNRGYMYWSEWSTSVINQAGMDGSQLAVIATADRPSGLTLDSKTRKLYWATQIPPIIESFELTTKKRRVLVNNDLQYPYALAQYDMNLIWSDSNTGNIEAVNKTNSSVRKLLHQQIEDVTSMKVYYTFKQSGNNVCRKSNGQCSHLCLISPDQNDIKYKCACSTHYTLHKDNVTCLAPMSFLIFSQRNSFGRLMPESTDCPDTVLPVSGLKNVRAVEYDPVTDYIYWVDGRSQSIRRSYTNGSASSLVVNGILHPFDLSLDPLGRLLFWSCAGTDAINVTNLDNLSSVGVIVQNDQEKPRSLAIHSFKRLLFWTDVGVQAGVMRARMDGSERSVLASDLPALVALAVDSELNLVFWAHSTQIDVSDLYGNNRKVLVSTQLIQISTMASLDGFLYCLDREQQEVKRIEVRTGVEWPALLQGMSHLTDLISVQPMNVKAMENHTCSKANHMGRCSHICVWSEDLSDGSVCGCPTGLILHEDKRTCGQRPACEPNQFTCTNFNVLSAGGNKECIPLSWRCDGHSDCPQGSDEVDCPTCRPDQFRCKSGQCIDKNWVCDGTTQCPDAHDEARCCNNPDDFQCPSNGLCISSNFVCDGWGHCPDDADESPKTCSQENNRRTETLALDSDKYSYIIGVLVVVPVLVIFALIMYYFRKHMAKSNNTRIDDQSEDPLSPRLTMPDICLSNEHNKSAKLSGHEVRMSTLNSNTSSSNSYDRKHITGASSSTTNGSSLACYPRETLNPPPSPATTANSTRYSSASSRYRPYRHYRAINQPPPPTPCSTDVCDESDSNYPSRYRYESEPFPPPPTPRSYYHSDAGILPESCPPSPSSRSSTYFSPLPPPPSPVPSPSRGYD